MWIKPLIWSTHAKEIQKQACEYKIRRLSESKALVSSRTVIKQNLKKNSAKNIKRGVLWALKTFFYNWTTKEQNGTHWWNRKKLHIAERLALFVSSWGKMVFESYREWKAPFGCLETVFWAFHESVEAYFKKLRFLSLRYSADFRRSRLFFLEMIWRQMQFDTIVRADLLRGHFGLQLGHLAVAVLVCVLDDQLFDLGLVCGQQLTHLLTAGPLLTLQQPFTLSHLTAQRV